MADPELAAVESALNTLALAESESALQKVVTRLLPALLTALSTKSAAARAKCIETLQHINVRIRALKNPRLPFTPVLQVAIAPNAAPLTTNVAIQGGYLARCFNTLSQKEQADAFPELLQAAAAVASDVNRTSLHNLAIQALASASKEFPSSTEDPIYRRIADLPEEPVHSFLSYGLLALRQKLPKPTPEAHLVALVRLASEYAGVQQPARAARVFPHFVVAAGTASRSAVCAAGEDALKKVDTCDVLAAEDPGIASTLFELFADPLAEIPLRIVILSKGLLRVTLCASCFPEVLEVMRASLHTPGVPPRLHGLGMQFVSFVAAHAAEGTLEENAEQFVDILMKLVRNETDGSPSFSDKLRAFGYTGLSEMVVRIPKLMGKHGVTAEFFFQASQATELPAEVRSAAAHALVALTRVVFIKKDDDSDNRKLILSTLLRTVQNDADVAASARAAAVQWANECFEFADCDARLVNIIACADLKQDVRQQAAFGLSSMRWRLPQMGKDLSAEAERAGYPHFPEVVETFMSHASANVVQPSSVLGFMSFALSTLIRALEETGTIARIQTDLLEPYFCDNPASRAALTQLRDTANDALTTKTPEKGSGLERGALSVILFASKIASQRQTISQTYGDRVEELVSLIQKNSAAGDVLTARALSVLVGIACESLSEDRLLAVIVKMGEGLAPNPTGSASGRFGEDERAAKILALGQIISRCKRRKDFILSETGPISEQCLNITRRVTLAVDASDVVRTAACTALAEVGVCGPLPIPSASRAVALSSLAGILKLHSSGARLVEAAADALGKICVGEPRTTLKKIAVDALLEVCRQRKEDEVRFTAAESLVRCVSGFDAPPPAMTADDAGLSSSGKGNSSNQLPSVLLMREYPHVVRESVRDMSEDEEKYEMQGVIRAVVGIAHDERPNARAGGCVCLFTFLRLLGSSTMEQRADAAKLRFASSEDKLRFEGMQKELSTLLPDVQQAFTVLLGDRSDFVQQLASCGVALVYEMCPPKEQRDLVSTLVRSLTAGKSKAATTVPGDQGGLLDLGGVGRSEGGASGGSATYKELCTLAQDMGQPELVYRFMDLAGHTALWNNRRGAALAGTALLGSEVAAEQLRPHATSLLPRLYVYCYDPTESVRVAMGSVLSAVVKAAGFGTVAEAVSQNFELITQHCLKSMTSRQWRSREAACGALRDSLVSRTWEQVGESLAEFWYITLRALDDIKESVRKAAEGTGRALSDLSIHLCNPGQVGVDIASKAIAVVIPSVLPAFTHAVAEVRLLATKTLSDVIRFGGQSLTESVPDLVEALLEAATEMEPQVLNYAEFHVDSREELQNARVDAASMSSSPLIDSLERLSGYVDESIIDQLVPKLTRLSRIGVGIPTRAATARFFATLLRSRAAVVEPYASRLMFAAAAGAGMERNMTLRGLWCAAVGGAARLSSTEDVGKLVERIVQYSGSEDAMERSLASSLAVGLWRKSPDTARQHASAMLPIAYMGRYETDEDAKGAGTNWKEVWGEGAPSSAAGLRLYAREIVEICETRLRTSTQYRVKRSAAAALGALAEASNETVDVQYLGRAAKALLEALPGHIWDGKIVALEAIGTIASACSDLSVWHSVDGASSVVTKLLSEAKRGKREYRIAAIESTAKLLNKCRDEVDLFDEVHSELGPVVSLGFGDSSFANDDPSTDASRLIWETGTDASAVDARNKARKANKMLGVASIACTEASFASSKRTEYQAKHIDTLMKMLQSSLRGDWEVRLGALQSLQRVTERLDGGVLESTTSADGQTSICRVVEMAEIGIMEAKYAAIRRCGFVILLNLSERVKEKSLLSECFSNSLKEAAVFARDKDGDSSVQADAKKLCTLFDLKR